MLSHTLPRARSQDLASHLAREGRFSAAAATFLVAEVVEAVAQLHARGIVHRALSPESILLDAAGHVRLTDFAAAKVCEAAVVSHGGADAHPPSAALRDVPCM
jgi:eukaryotic-like serine/threonine-protein kinase